MAILRALTAIGSTHLNVNLTSYGRDMLHVCVGWHASCGLNLVGNAKGRKLDYHHSQLVQVSAEEYAAQLQDGNICPACSEWVEADARVQEEHLCGHYEHGVRMPCMEEAEYVHPGNKEMGLLDEYLCLQHANVQALFVRERLRLIKPYAEMLRQAVAA